MKALNVIVLLLIVIGALNWGLIGFFGFDLVSAIFGGSMVLSRIVYAIVGLAGLWSLSFFGKVKCFGGNCSCSNKHEPKQ